MADYPMTIEGRNWHETLRFTGPDGFEDVVSERSKGEDFSIGTILARATRDVRAACPMEADCDAKVRGHRENYKLVDVAIRCMVEVCPLANT